MRVESATSADTGGGDNEDFAAVVPGGLILLDRRISARRAPQRNFIVSDEGNYTASRRTAAGTHRRAAVCSRPGTRASTRPGPAASTGTGSLRPSPTLPAGPGKASATWATNQNPCFAPTR